MKNVSLINSNFYDDVKNIKEKSIDILILDSKPEEEIYNIIKDDGVAILFSDKYDDIDYDLEIICDYTNPKDIKIKENVKFNDKNKYKTIVVNCKYKDNSCYENNYPNRNYSLLDYIIGKYTKKTGILIDTHMGSGFSIKSCEDYDLSFVGYEDDKCYYEQAFELLESEE